jgi:hypothetical protein
MIFQPVYAVGCPVCIITIGGGLYLAEVFKIDSLLIAIWISGLNSVIAIWLGKIFKNGKYNFPYLWTSIFYIFTVFYFLYTKEIVLSKNLFWGMNKTLLGLTIGFSIVVVSNYLDQVIRNNNNGKVLFFYQKVIIPVSLLIISTIIFKFLI